MKTLSFEEWCTKNKDMIPEQIREALFWSLGPVESSKEIEKAMRCYYEWDVVTSNLPDGSRH